MDGQEHRLTVPNHRAIRVGTLGSIMTDLSEQLGIPQSEVRRTLFGS